MKRFAFCMMTLAVAALVGSVGAEQVKEDPIKQEQSLRLELDLDDGSHVVGVPSIETVAVQTPYAKMDVPLKQIAVMRIGRDRETVSLDLRNGDKLTGVISLGRVELRTVFGKIAVGLEHLQELRVVLSGGAATRKGLVLWNRLESESDVRESRVGPGGERKGGRFVVGRFGKGMELNMQEPLGVTFPLASVPIAAGCLEFWAKLVDFPQDLPWGQKPGLIGVSDKEESNRGSILHFNGNDGAANGGLCAGLGGVGSAGTGQYGSWTYARAMGSEAVGDWHHYALVWAAAGIPDVADGKRGLAVFVDGRLNTGSWNGAAVPPGPLALPSDGRLGLLCHQSLSSGRVVFDNLKIWNYAKTDFDDRNEE